MMSDLTQNVTLMAFDRAHKYMAIITSTSTYIKVFNIEEHRAKLRVKFRTGIVPKTIYTMAISDDQKWLACVCSTSSVQIFTIPKFHCPNGIPSPIIDCWPMVMYPIEKNTYHTCQFDSNGVLHVVSSSGTYCKIYGENFGEMTRTKISSID